MSEEQLKAFLEKVKDDIRLQEKLNAAKSPDEIVAIAKDAGFTICVSDWQKAEPTGLSDEELESMAAGFAEYLGFGTRITPMCNHSKPPICTHWDCN
jgi:predicted ribosomally synthesized peptide with nif11-like leader